MSAQPLPWFDRPPVVETVLGVQFDELPGLTNAHLGAFWSQLGLDWPKVRDIPKLEPQFEEFGSERTWALLGARLTLIQDPSVRLQIRNNNEDRMIQVQNGRFHYNWLDKPGVQYPRYEKRIRPEFDRLWSRFHDFLISTINKAPKLNQWEVTYVNHIPRETLWTQPADWARVLPGLLAHRPTHGVGTFESVGGQWHFEIPSKRGRLHVQLVHGKRVEPDSAEVVRMDLTARGPIAEDLPPDEALGAGLDLGRATIVRMFIALTSEEAHKFWGIHNG